MEGPESRGNKRRVLTTKPWQLPAREEQAADGEPKGRLRRSSWGEKGRDRRGG